MEPDRGWVAPLDTEVPMVDSETVRLMKELSQRGWKLKRIARELGVARNTVRHYVRDDASAGLQKHIACRRLDEQQRAEARRLLEGPAAGNAVVVKRLLCEQGVEASVRTVQRAVAEHRQERRAAQTEQTYLDFLDGLLREEVGSKQRKRIAMGIQIAHFPSHKTLDDFDFGFQPSVDRKLVMELATGRFVAQADNVLLFGPPGVGKTHLSIGLGRAVVEAGHSVLFVTATALLAMLARAETEGKLGEQLTFFTKPKLLVIDELGYLPFEKRSAHLFFQLVVRRYERGSMLVTTNQPVTQWGQVLGDEMIAAAILDRLLHHSHTIVIQGESYRLKHKKRAGLLGATQRG